MQGTIGHVWAFNTDDPSDRRAIGLGYVTGDGLLGETLKAICKLMEATVRYECCITETACNAVEAARLNLYDALKTIEIAGLEVETGEHLSYPCAHCGTIAKAALCYVGVLDSGTVLFCGKCGKGTVVDLDTPEDRAARYKLAGALGAVMAK